MRSILLPFLLLITGLCGRCAAETAYEKTHGSWLIDFEATKPLMPQLPEQFAKAARFEIADGELKTFNGDKAAGTITFTVVKVDGDRIVVKTDGERARDVTFELKDGRLVYDTGVGQVFVLKKDE